MLRGVLILRSKRTPGYVFWRQSTLIELEHSKRNYLLSERPVPVAEISRRMIRVRSRYLDTQDFNEQNLLRGEYKYFSGKLCDLRHARLEDMVAYLDCCAFFGFWDSAQVDRVMNELSLKLDEIGHLELVHLFVSLPALRKQSSPLFYHTVRALVAAVPDLSVDECLRVAVACDEAAPDALVENLMRAIEPVAAHGGGSSGGGGGGISPAQAVELLDAWGNAAQVPFTALFANLKRTAAAGLPTLSVMDIAVLCTALQLRNAMDSATERAAIRCFLDRMDETCARSVAMMFTAVHEPFALSQAMTDRVVFLATDFDPGELLSVLAVYLNDYASLCAPTSVSGPSSPSGPSGPSLHCTSALRHVVSELLEHMLALLESAAAHVSPAVQLQHVALFSRAAEAIGGATRLAADVPHTARCLQILSAKAIASMRQYAYEELVALLQMCAPLGRLFDDAAVGAAVRELARREVPVTGAGAAEMCEALQDMRWMRAEHRTRIETALLPKLRERCAQGAV